MIITILRNPLEGTVAENTLKHGCGALNIDATRVGLEVMISSSMSSLGVMHDDDWKSKPIEPVESTGRWPANFILTHKDGCELKGTKKVKSNGHWTQKANIGKFYEGGWSHQEVDEGNKMSDGDGNEEVEDWYCEQDCPVRDLDQQSGHLKSGLPTGTKKAGTGYNGNFPGGEMTGFGDEGGASRFFKKFKRS